MRLICGVECWAKLARMIFPEVVLNTTSHFHIQSTVILIHVHIGVCTNMFQSICFIISAYCTIQFRYVPKYPDEPPHFEIIESDNLEDHQLDIITNLIKETVSIPLPYAFFFGP